MTISADLVTPVVDAAPGEAAFGTVRLHNAGSTPATVRVVTVGLDAAVSGNGHRAPATAAVTVQPGQICDVPVAIDVPATLGIGDHAAAFQVVSERVGDRPLLVPFTVSIASVERVELTPYPSTIRGRRRANFRLDLVNHEDTPVDVAIEGSAPEVQVRFAQPRVQLLPGQHAVTKGKLKGPRRWSGEPTQHTVVITARGRASATSVTAAYVQRPLFAAKLRMITAALVVIALWAGAIGAFAWWWSGRGDDDGDRAATSGQIDGVDTDGDGVLDTFFDADGNVVYGIDTDGDGEPDAFFDADGNPVADPREGGGGDGAGDGSGDGSGDGDGGAAAGTRSTIVRGTVTADGDISDVAITMSPIQLGQRAQRSGIMGFASGPAPSEQDDGGGDDTIAKIWSARFAAVETGTLNPVRQTEPIRPLQTNPEANGLWTFTDVPLRQSYELVFTKPGYQVQSFVITPPEDGSPVELDVELEAAVGAISGRVSGPSGPLGGVAITVTDGSLTFETTSATVGDVGSWSVEGLSTPAVYTVVGELRGYGTEVLQIRLEAGQTLGGANLNMRPGVGSISGRVVGAGGAPLGGVTVTATNGEESRTTSSLTEGNIGFFNIPQLDIPGTYTVSVSHEGYIGQTRRIPVSGAVGGVDFTLLRTTLRLTGRITSSERGQGVANAGLTLSNGELTFKVSTAADPTPGTFVVDDLPPGNYTVTIEHYQHETTTEFITLTAGLTPPPLDVELQWRSGGPEIGTGTLVVEVVDNGADSAERREIKDATVRLVRIQDNKELPPITQHAFNFRIPNLEVGTYLLYVTAPKYNPAPPRRVSIGLSEQRVEVSLQRLGQALGRLVDRTDPTKTFDRYFVQIYRADDPPSAPFLLRLPARSDGTWQTLPDTMIPGAYRIKIEDADTPPGYTVHHNQLLDPDAPGATPADKWMVFVVPEGAFDPVVVSDIYADPYPEITGRVFRSSLVSASGFAEIDHPDLRVTMSCPDGTDFDAELTDEAGVVADAGDPPRYETFRITKEQIDANNLTGNCELTAQAAAPLLPVTMPLAGVDAGQSTTAPLRRVSLALPVAPPSVGGRVFWRDGTTPVYLQGVTVAAQPVTSYTPIDGTTDITQVPNRVLGALSTTSDVDGQWELTGQIAGTTNYRFTADNFAEAIVPFTVDPGGLLSHGTPVNAEVNVTSGRYQVELSDPVPGAGRGSIRIRTTKPTPAFAQVGITTTSPSGTEYTEGAAGSPIERDATPVGDTLGFDLHDLQPGTWTVEFTPPANHAFFEGPPAGSVCAVVDPSTVCQLVPPGTTRSGFDASLVELGRLELTLLDSDGIPLAVAPEDIHVSLTGGNHDDIQQGPANEFEIEGIEVHATDPVGQARCYVLTVTVDRHDAPSAVVDAPAAPGCTGDEDGSLGIPLAFLAGSDLTVEIEMPEYGTIEGSVIGQVGPATEDIPLTTDRISVTPIELVHPEHFDPDDLEVRLTGNEFVVSGPPGRYLITVNHPNFEVVPLTFPVDEFDAGLPPGEFLMVDDDTNEIGAFLLDIRKGTLNISVVDTLADGNPIDGAIYCLSGMGTSQSGRIDDGGQIGEATISDLVPGTYTLQLRKFFDADVTTCTQPLSDQSAFPTITTVEIGRGTELTPADTRVRAPLPALAASLAGTIVAENLDGDPVPLPVTVGTYEVTFSYEPPIVEQDRTGDPTPPAVPPGPGQFLDDDCVVLVGDPPIARCTADIDVDEADGGTVGYEFQYMPAGAHQVTLSTPTVNTLAAAGYTLSGSATQTGTRTGEFTNVGPQFLFTAQYVQLVIELAPDDQLVEITPNSVSLTHPDLDDPIQTYAFDSDDNTITFDNIAPRVGPYSLQVAATLHHTLNVSDIDVPVTPGAAPVVQRMRHMSPNLARVSGTVQRCDGPGETDCAGLVSTAGGLIELLDAPDATTPFRSSSGPSSFQFDVPPDQYWIKVSQDGYSTAVVPVDLTEDAGKHEVDDVDITIEKEATVTVTVGNGTSLTGTISIQLRSVGASGTTYSPRPGPVGSPPQATFDVPPGDYNVVVSAGNYTEEEIDVPDSSVGVGAAANWTVYLPRKVELSVLNTGTADVTVSVFQNGANLATADPITYDTDTADERFTFSLPYNPASPPPWFSQPLVIQVTAPDFRTQVVTTSTALQPTIADVHMARHVELSGSIVSDESDANKSGTDLVRATSPGVPDILGDVVDGTFTLTGLTNNLVTGGSRVWSISYDKPGVGTSATRTVTVSAANTVGSFDLTPVPRQIEVRVAVTDQDGPVTGATVTVGSGAATEDTENPGTYVRTVNETFESVTWTASKTGHVSANGTVPNLTSRPANPIVVNASLPSRMVTVTVLGPDAGNPPIESGLTFTICQLNGAQTNCAMGGSPGPVTGGVTHLGAGVYRFVAPTTAGNHRLHVNGTDLQQATRTFNVPATGGGIPNPRTLTTITMAAASP